jgi:ferrous iron transport protein B
VTTLNLPQLNAPRRPQPKPHPGPKRVLLAGNPNAGKTALFNALTGLRAKTANFPGTTVELRRGRLRGAAVPDATVIDLPGLYSLDGVSPEERVAEAAIKAAAPHPDAPPADEPDLIVLVLDATQLERHLVLAGQVLELNKPTLIALNLIDAARQQGIATDAVKLSQQLECPVIPVSARTHEGIEQLHDAIADRLAPPPPDADNAQACATDCSVACGSCPFAGRYAWAEQIARSAGTGPVAPPKLTVRLDAVLTHALAGPAALVAVMFLVFLAIFSVAAVPMDMIDWLFGSVGQWVASATPDGLVQSFLVDAVIGGIGGVIIFLPQIMLLFFLITLLEDSGYFARAAFVAERFSRYVGLPGTAVIPMISAHACAIPAIMSTRVIDNWRDRLATILVLPLLTCSARMPVYVLLVGLLFAGNVLHQTLAITACYFLGIAAALVTALVLKLTILRGKPAPLVMELPAYRRPSLSNALLVTAARGWMFIKKAGTTILLISVVLWAMATFPQLPDDQLAAADTPAVAAEAVASPETQQLAHSLAGRAGQLIEPVFAPLGWDWRIDVGVIASFAAREVFASTMLIMYGLDGEAELDDPSLLATLRQATHPDGSLVFTTATCLSLLVFFVLAMQCLPTQVVTRKETGSWKWAILQFGYMTALAYTAALITYQVASAIGLNA